MGSSATHRADPARLPGWLVDHSPVDAARDEDVRRQLLGLVIRLGNRIGDRDKQLLDEFIGAGEFGLALEQMADLLAEATAALTQDERGDLLALARAMAMGDRLARALRFCPPLRR